MTEENIMDVQAEEVVDEPVQPEEPEMTYHERKAYEKARVTTLNKMLKNYRRQQKNPLFIAKKLSE